jgi:hypothetical protein
MSGQERACLNCQFWFTSAENPNEDSQGECRFNPAVFVRIESSVSQPWSASDCWPVSSGRSWCGQFKAKRYPQRTGI